MHLLRVILIAAVIIFATTQVALAQYAEWTGRILDPTGAAIAKATVSVVGKQNGLTRETTSDDQGVYFLSALRPDEYLVKVQAAGFETASHDRIKVEADRRTVLDITLQVARLANEDLTVKGDTAHVSVPPSTIDVTPLAVRSVAGAGENIFRVLQTLPGVTFTSDFASRLAVRGGGPDQNLTLMDGVEIHNPYRLFGLTSAFNPEVVENFELTAGAFSAKYGDRLSSILIVDNRPGTRDKSFTATSAMSFTDGNVVAEGKLPGTTNGSWLVTGRRTYYDLIAERFVDADLPSFNDLQAKGVWESSKGQRITVFGLQSRERTDADLDEEDLGEDAQPGERFALQAATNNDLAAVSFSTPIGRRASSKTTVSWYRNHETLNFDADVQDEARRSNRPEKDAIALSDLVFTRNLGIRDVAVRQETVVQAHPSHLLDFGFDSHSLRTDWTWRITGERNGDAPNGSSNQIGAGLPSLLDSNRSTWRAGAWFSDKWNITRRLQLEAGVRIDWSGLADETIASPRLAAAMDIGAGLRLRVAGGLFTQSPGYEKLLQSDYFVDLSNADSIGLRSEQARHALVSVERQMPGGIVARVEGYYKRFDHLLLGRLETPDETRTRVGTYDFPADLAWSVPTAPLITSFPTNNGTGRAYGVDFYVARQARSASDRLTGWASYTWGKSETTAYGRTFLADYDHPHSLSVVATYRWSELIDLGTTVRVQSGFPFTPALGVRVASTADANDLDGDGNLTELIPMRDSQGLFVWGANYGDLSNLKSARLPLYARVDFRATFKPGWMNRRWQIYIEVMNLLNRRNAGSLAPELLYNPDGDRPIVSNIREGSLPLLPSLGVRFRF